MKIELLNQLRADVAYVEDALVALNDSAEGSKLTDEAQASWDAGLAYLGDTENSGARFELAALELRAKYANDIVNGQGKRADAPNFHRSAPTSGDIDLSNASSGTIRDAAMRAIENADKSYLGRMPGRATALDKALNLGESKDYSSAAVARAIVATSTEAYQSAFVKGVSGQSALWTAAEQSAYIDAQNASLTGNEGGFGIPTLIDPTVIITSGATGSALIDAATVVPVTTTTWKGVSAAGSAWSMDAASAQVSEDTPVFAQPSIAMQRTQSYIKYPIELEMDYPSWVTQVETILSTGYRTIVATQAAIGTGTPPQTTGIFPGVTTTVDVTTDNAFSGADIDAAYAAVPEDFRANGTWVMDVTVENAIRAFGADNQSRFTVDQSAGGITLLNGKPVVLSDHAPNLLVATDAAPILIFGDMAGFVIGQRLGMTLMLDGMVKGADQRPTGEMGLFAIARFGTGVINQPALRKLKNITT